MSDFIDRLAQIRGLPARDAIVARALVRGGVVAAETVLETAATVAADPTGPDLLGLLTRANALDARRARVYEEALEKKLAERRVHRAGGDEEKDRLSDDESDGEAFRDLKEERERLERAESCAFFATHMRSDLQERILDVLRRAGGGSADPVDVATRVGADVADVTHVLVTWRKNRTLQCVAGIPFYYAPSPRQKKKIERALRAWRSPRERARCIETVQEEAYAAAFADFHRRWAKVARRCAAAEKARDELQRSVRELSSSEAKIKALSERIEHHRTENEALRAQLEKAALDVEQVRIQLSLKEQYIRQLTAERDGLRALEEKRAALVAEYDAMKQRIARFARAWRQASAVKERTDSSRRFSSNAITRAYPRISGRHHAPSS
jgi:hypothetical protein